MLFNSYSYEILYEQFRWIYLQGDIKFLLVLLITGFNFKSKSFTTYRVTCRVVSCHSVTKYRNNFRHGCFSPEAPPSQRFCFVFSQTLTRVQLSAVTDRFCTRLSVWLKTKQKRWLRGASGLEVTRVQNLFVTADNDDDSFTTRVTRTFEYSAHPYPSGQLSAHAIPCGLIPTPRAKLL